MINKTLEDSIGEILKKHDPMKLIEIGAPEQEYEVEAGIISDKIYKCESIEEARDMIYHVFVQNFEYGFKLDGSGKRRVDKGGAGRKQDYEKVAKEIHALLRN
jgi:hypothetical protein